MRRFYVDALSGAGLVLPPAVAHHIAVLRLPLGTHVHLFARDGMSVQAVLESAEYARFVTDIAQATWQSGVTLAVPLVKGDRQDWLIEKACELGVDAIVPLLCERAVIRELSSNKEERFARLVEAACKQCGRDMPLRLSALTPVSQVQFAHAVVLDPRAACGMASPLSTPVTLFVGPEGGFTDAEVSALVARGAHAARIAPFILRAETAALAASAVAMASVVQ